MVQEVRCATAEGAASILVRELKISHTHVHSQKNKQRNTFQKYMNGAWSVIRFS